MRLVILGGGFAGLRAASGASALIRSGVEVLLVDRNSFATMIPSLPDAAGGRMNPDFLKEDIRALLPDGMRFLQAEIRGINLERREIETGRGLERYDALVLATGSEAQCGPYEAMRSRIHPLARLEDAERIRDEFSDYCRRAPSPRCVMAGAGYTGLELAGNLAALAEKLGKRVAFTIVEKAPAILPFLNAREKRRVDGFLARNSFDLRMGVSLESLDGGTIRLTDGTIFKDAFLCWSVGTCFSVNRVEGRMERLTDGRIKVSRELQVPAHPEVFACGDAAAMEHRGGYLRKAVNFAFYSGLRAGKNAAAFLLEHKMKPFRPVDLGWVIPLVDDSVGRIMGGLPVWGRTGLRLHYFMCGYRNFSGRNMRAFIRMALRLK